MLQKTAQNHKNRPPERPKLDLYVIFGTLLLTFCIRFPETSILWKHAYSLGRSQYLRSWHLIFSSKIHSKIVFFRDAFLDLVFLHFIWNCLWKCVIFGPPRGSAGAQNGTPNRSSGAQMSQFLHRRSVFLAVFKTTCFQDRSRSAPGHHCGWFWDGFWMDFPLILEPLLMQKWKISP